MENWLNKQIETISDEWANSIAKYYPEHLQDWNNPDKHLKMLNEKINTFEAVKLIDWEKYLINGTKILDLGCGTGWLSAYLSQYQNVSFIDALDSDKKNLECMLPEMVKLLDGDIKKINLVRGLFTPIQKPNGYYDIIVASSAVHHANSLYEILPELKRVLKSGGKLFILNETPTFFLSMLNKYIKGFLGIFFNLLQNKSTTNVSTYSQHGILYDPYLGDHIYSYQQWDKAIRFAGFKYSIVHLPFGPYKGISKGLKLKHFICE